MKKIFIITGELSGESHAGRVLYELLKLNPQLKVRAMGSSILGEMGARVVIDYKNYGFNGFTEVIKNLPKILKLKELIIEEIIKFNPDLVLGVDYSGLNLEIAATLKKRLKDKRPKFVQFIAPQLWASRPYRIKKVKANVDKVLCTLPFEEDLYIRHNVPVTYVGNPVLGSMSPKTTKHEFLQEFVNSAKRMNIDPSNSIDASKYQSTIEQHSTSKHQSATEHLSLSETAYSNPENYLDENQLLLGIFPGSRSSEIKHLLPIMVKAAYQLRQRIPNSRFVLAKAATISSETLFKNGLEHNTDHLGNTLIEILEPKMMFNANHKLLAAADLLWLCSGTVTLEAALYAKPHFLCYKGDKLSYLAYRLFRTIDMAGLANIIARKYLVKEFLQNDASVENFIKETLSWLSTEYLDGSLSAASSEIVFSDYYNNTVKELVDFKTSLVAKSATTQELVAQEIIALL